MLIKKLRPAGRADSVAIDSFYALPARIVGVAADQELAFLRPAFLPEGELKYVPRLDRFQGGFGIGLEDSIESRKRRELSGGFHFQIGGDADSVNPRGLDIGHTNLPLEVVQIFMRDPADSVRVVIATAADLRGTEVWLRARPALSFGQLRTTAQGLGLQRIPVTVSVLGTRRAAPFAVKLTSDRGSLEPDTLLVGSGMTTTISWRTEGLGRATIRAHAVGADDALGTIDFAFPVLFLVAAIIGGAAGAALRFMQLAESGPPLVRAMAAGMLAGVVSAAVYYAIGVSIVKIDVKVPFFNEAAVFSLAALAGLFGVGLGAGRGSVPSK